MESSIYYPSFEILDIDWLKFSLLCMDEIRPIAPFRANAEILTRCQFQSRDAFRLVLDETDLIRFYRPEYEDARFATERFCLEFPLFQRLINDRRAVRHKPLRDVVEQWSNPDNHTYELFWEKYVDAFSEFCLDERYGSPSDNGIKVPRQLAWLYMNILANVCGDAKGLSICTDSRSVHDLMKRLRRNVSSEKRVSAIKYVIDIEIPDIRCLSIEEVIKLRNSAGFKKAMKGFNQEIDRHFNEIENISTAQQFINSYKRPNFSLMARIATMATPAITIAISGLLPSNIDDVSLRTVAVPAGSCAGANRCRTLFV